MSHLITKEEYTFPVYTGERPRCRSTVYLRTVWLGRLLHLSQVQIAVGWLDGQRVLQRLEHGIWPVGLEILAEGPEEVIVRLAQVSYQYRQRVFPYYDEAELAALQQRGYDLDRLWSEEDFYLGTDALAVLALRPQLQLLAYDASDDMPVSLHEPVRTDAVLERLQDILERFGEK